MESAFVKFQSVSLYYFYSQNKGYIKMGRRWKRSAFAKIAICVFVLFLQIKPGLDNKGEKVDGMCFCKYSNLCPFIIFTDKTRVR